MLLNGSTYKTHTQTHTHAHTHTQTHKHTNTMPTDEHLKLLSDAPSASPSSTIPSTRGSVISIPSAFFSACARQQKQLQDDDLLAPGNPLAFSASTPCCARARMRAQMRDRTRADAIRRQQYRLVLRAWAVSVSTSASRTHHVAAAWRRRGLGHGAAPPAGQLASRRRGLCPPVSSLRTGRGLPVRHLECAWTRNKTV